MTDFLVAHQIPEQPYKGLGCCHLGLLTGRLHERRIDLIAGQLDDRRPHPPFRQITAQLPPPLLKVDNLLGVVARVVVRRVVSVLELAVGNLQIQPVSEGLEILGGQLLHLVGGVSALKRADGPALDRLCQDHGWLAHVLGGCLERRVDLAVVMPAAREHLDLIIGHPRDHLLQSRIGEEVVANVGAILDQVGLELTVRRGVHLVHQNAVGVGRQQGIPVGPTAP